MPISECNVHVVLQSLMLRQYSICKADGARACCRYQEGARVSPEWRAVEFRARWVNRLPILASSTLGAAYYLYSLVARYGGWSRSSTTCKGFWHSCKLTVWRTNHPFISGIRDNCVSGADDEIANSTTSLQLSPAGAEYCLRWWHVWKPCKNIYPCYFHWSWNNRVYHAVFNEWPCQKYKKYKSLIPINIHLIYQLFYTFGRQ